MDTRYLAVIILYVWDRLCYLCARTEAEDIFDFLAIIDIKSYRL